MNIKRVMDGAARAWRYVVSDIWDVELSSLPALRSLGVRTLRVISLVFKGFYEDECPIRASALTYNTLMAIVPILALSLAVVRGMGGGELAKERMREKIREYTQAVGVPLFTIEAPAPAAASATVAGTNAPPETVKLTPDVLADRMVDLGMKYVGNISFSALGGIGLVLLIWMIITVFGGIEDSFNRVWGVTSSRSVWRKFTDYLSLLFVLPILIAAASSLHVVDLVTQLVHHQSTAEVIRTAMTSIWLKNFTTFVLTCLTFAFIIMFMPNTRVRLLPGLIGGFIAGMLFILWLRVCITLQVGAANYGAIYASFAVVPILLAWVYVSWEIVLLGAETAFAVQNHTTYQMEQGAHRANYRARMTLALSVVLEAARGMLGKSPHFDVSMYAGEKKVPVRFLNDIVGDLVRGGFLGELSGQEGSFVLLKAPGSLRVQEVMDWIMSSGVKPEALGLRAVEPAVARVIKEAEEGISGSLQEKTIKDLLPAE